MEQPRLHRFELDGKRFVIDPETCFCFECDAISWDVIEHFPHETMTSIVRELGDRHPEKEVAEVLGELEWLRATKAILQKPKLSELDKLYALDRGLRSFCLEVGEHGEADIQRVGAMLLGRAAADRQDLELELRLDHAALERPGLGVAIERLGAHAQSAGKQLTVALALSPFTLHKTPPILSGFGLRPTIHWRVGAGPLSDLLRALRRGIKDLKQLAALLSEEHGGATGKLVLRPVTGRLVEGVKVLAEAGVLHLELDLDEACLEAGANHGALFEELKTLAWAYARNLQAGHYFRLEPLASYFHQIHQGEVSRRGDPAGFHTLALDRQGIFYPGPGWLGCDASPLQKSDAISIDEAALRRFEDVGSLTTPACMKCWARNLCGGGRTVVHQALSGSWRKPHEAWCDGQRSFLETCVAAFNVLSRDGVNFSRLRGGLAKPAKLSLFQMARAAFRMQIGLRPIGESDAPLLKQWESWNGAAYFTATPHGVLLSTDYDREMDALHPRPFEQEFLLLRKNGEPMGLLRMKPDLFPGTVLGWLYFRHAEDYQADKVRKSFRFLLEEAAKQQQDMHRILVQVGPEDEGLTAFLEATGFRKLGTQRDALFLHRRYHDLDLYALTLRQDL